MKIQLSLEEVKYALLVHLFTTTGIRWQPEDVYISDLEVNREASDDSISALDITIGRVDES